MVHPQILIHRRGLRTRVLMLDHRCPDFKFALWHRLAPCLVSHQNNVVLTLLTWCIYPSLLSSVADPEVPSPLSQGLDDHPPPPSEVWIRHCLCVTVFNLF